MTNSGQLVDPKWYEHGGDGFVVAVFESEVFVTEVPNAYYADGVFREIVVPVTRPPVKKRPSAPMKRPEPRQNKY